MCVCVCARACVCVCVCVRAHACACMCSVVSDFVIPWAVARKPPLSMEFSRQEHWSGLSFPPPGNLPYLGIKPATLVFPALTGRFSTTAPPGKPSLAPGEAYFFFPFFIWVCPRTWTLCLSPLPLVPSLLQAGGWFLICPDKPTGCWGQTAERGTQGLQQGPAAQGWRSLAGAWRCQLSSPMPFVLQGGE